jgi:photosystem II stability/assembly factor-like uncharacterized protein
MKKLPIYILFFCFALSAHAQPWRVIAESKKPDPNFNDLQQAFTEYFDNYSKSVHDVFRTKTGFYENEEVPGFFQFKRWEYFWESRTFPTGEFPNTADIYHEWQQQQQQLQQQDNTRSAANWTLMGPMSTVPTGGGVGRVGCIRFNPLNANIVWAGSPAGGLWKSTNGGTNWATNTDNLPVIGVSDIAINPMDTTIMYIATGDADASDTYSMGVMKSTNSGGVWSATGLTWVVNAQRTVRRLIINPSNPDILLAATSNGIYRTLDAGVNWTQERSGSFRDIEFMPGNANIVYAVSSSQFFKSIDGGHIWSNAITSTGFPVGDVGRVALAVTPANPNVVYALCSAGDNSFRGFYKSTDEGNNWTLQSNSPNILGWSNDGSDLGVGQGWYDLAVAASPTTENTVLIGGIHIWRSTNGGSSWILSAYNSAHADCHDIYFANSSGTSVYAGTDGGVFYNNSTGSTPWTNKSATLQIQQDYRLSNSQTVSTTVVTGAQDNGTNKITSSGMSEILGGDGMECIIDYTNANIIYAELYYGDLNKSTSGGGGWNNIAPANDGNWVTPYVIHPSNPSILYAGYTSIYKTTNGGTSWNGGTNSIAGQYRSMAVAPSNGNYVYAATQTSIYRSTDGAQTWTNITSGLPSGSLALTYITVKYDDPQTLWVTYSGYTSSIKVYKSINAGASWTNATATGLPNVPANCIVNEPNNPMDALYIGTDLGVYYRNNTMTNWIPYMTGLPNVPVFELEVQLNAGKVRAATYGRGIWQSDLAVGIVGTEELTNKSDGIMVYPNPSNGTVFVQADAQKKIERIEVFDVVGKKIMEINHPAIISNLIQLDMSKFRNGVYSVALSTGSERTVKEISLLR